MSVKSVLSFESLFSRKIENYSPMQPPVVHTVFVLVFTELIESWWDNVAHVDT